MKQLISYMSGLSLTFALLLALPLPLLLAGCSEEANDEDFSLIKVGDVMPQFTIKSVDGLILNSQNIEGKKVFIYFFASYCDDCRNVTPSVIELWNQVRDDANLEFICVARGGSGNATLEAAKMYWTEVAVSCGVAPEAMPTLYYDGDRGVYGRFASQNVPRYYVVDRENRISWQGEGSYSAQSLNQYIQAAK